MKKNSTMHKINPFMLFLISSFLFIAVSNLNAQITRKVLFLGNSYTAVNNLPQIVHDVALSVGDTLIFDSHTPGGYSLADHGTDATSQSKIMAGGWDYAVLQGQSQEPVTHSSTFSGGGRQLNNFMTQYNPCSVTMLYMTWGRKNGDALNCPAFPVMCTYEGMDSTIRKEYQALAAYIKGEISPVSVVWKYLRQNAPNIELYQPDESHPSLEGSYAAACCFYAAIFKKDPTLITFNSGLNAADASIIRNAAKTQVFDNLQLWDYKKPPLSDFVYSIGPGVNEVIFNAVNHGYQESYLWTFGDGATSSTSYSPHSYLSNGTYTVSLTTTNCDLQGLHTSTSDTVIQFCNHTPTIYTSNPWLCMHDTIWTEAADAYQWFNNGLPIPETNQYLPDYDQYDNGYLTVLSTTNGCSELSAPYSNTPDWSGYYFDIWAMNDPCVGDTAIWMVLHTSGSLSGFEMIEWYRNDTLLSLMTNEDTLYITEGGIYECRVIDPNAVCPLDTTSYTFEFDCSISGIINNVSGLSWNIFPNPASESITIKFSNDILKKQIQIYSATGRLLKVMEASTSTMLSIADLPVGMYFIRISNTNQPALKFIKQ